MSKRIGIVLALIVAVSLAYYGAAITHDQTLGSTVTVFLLGDGIPDEWAEKLRQDRNERREDAAYVRPPLTPEEIEQQRVQNLIHARVLERREKVKATVAAGGATAGLAFFASSAIHGGFFGNLIGIIRAGGTKKALAGQATGLKPGNTSGNPLLVPLLSAIPYGQPGAMWVRSDISDVEYNDPVSGYVQSLLFRAEVYVSAVGQTTLGTNVPQNNGAQFGPDTPGTSSGGLVEAFAGAGSGGGPNYAIKMLPGTLKPSVSIPLISAGTIFYGSGKRATVVQPTSSLVGDLFTGFGLVNWSGAKFDSFTIDATNLTATGSAASISISSGVPYTVPNDGFIQATTSGVTWTAAGCTIQPIGKSASQYGAALSPTSATISNMLGSTTGLYVNAGETFLATWSGGSPTFTLQSSNCLLNLTTLNYRTHSETGDSFKLSDIRYRLAGNAGLNGVGGVILDGCESAEVIDSIWSTSDGTMVIHLYNGWASIRGGNCNGIIAGCISLDIVSVTLLDLGLTIDTGGNNSDQLYTLVGGYDNGTTSGANFVVNSNTTSQKPKIVTSARHVGVPGGSNQVSGTGISNLVWDFGSSVMGPFTAGAFFSAAPANVMGTLHIPSTVTPSTLVAGIVTGNFALEQSGTITNYVLGIIALIGPNRGGPGIVASSAVLGAAATGVILSWTRPSIAYNSAVGRHIIRFTVHIKIRTVGSAAMTLVPSYTPPDGSCPAQLAWLQQGTAAITNSANAGDDYVCTFQDQLKSATAETVTLSIGGTAATLFDYDATMEILE